MNRVLPALVIGAAIAAGIVYIMTLLIGGDPVKPISTEYVSIVEPIDITEKPRPIDFYPDYDCESQIADFATLIASSRSCSVDADCELAIFGCPFGCFTAVDSDALPRLKREHLKVKRCQNCLYSCGGGGLGWKAACVKGQCRVVERTMYELEQQTRDAIAD